MNVALFGASGWIGGFICSELLGRGHKVTALVRDKSRLQKSHQDLIVREGDLRDRDLVKELLSGQDAVVASVSGRRDGDHRFLFDCAKMLLEVAGETGLGHLVWVGGAGSLEVRPGVSLLDTDSFPEEWRDEARVQREVLEYFRRSGDAVSWALVSPAMRIKTQEKLGDFRIGGDQLMRDEEGESQITVGDLAVSVVDEVECPAHRGERFSVAY